MSPPHERTWLHRVPWGEGGRELNLLGGSLGELWENQALTFDLLSALALWKSVHVSFVLPLWEHFLLGAPTLCHRRQASLVLLSKQSIFRGVRG